MTTSTPIPELPGLVAELRGRSAIAPWRGRGEAELNARAADTLESLAAENERLIEEVAKLRERMSDMMPIAGGNPMKNMGRNYGLSSKDRKALSGGSPG